MNPGLAFIDLAEVTGGVVASICDADWNPILETIGSGLHGPDGSEVTLREPADPQSLQAAIDDGTLIVYGAESLVLSADGLVVTLPVIPPIGASITVRYAPEP